MDASAGAENNGDSVPTPGSLPSAAAAPQGAPVGASNVEVPAGSSEPLVVLEKPTDPVRDEKGRIKKGHSLNPKGRQPGIPNLNNELNKAIKQFKIGDRSFLYLILAKSLQDVEYFKLIHSKILAEATPPAAASGVNIHNSLGQTNVQAETNVRLIDHLRDPGVRDTVADLVDKLQARGAFSGSARHGGN